MPFDPAPLIAALVLLAIASLLGMGRITKIIQVYEAKHELKQGSAGFLRAISGWAMIFIWGMAVWYFATIIGDWWVSDDLAGAVDRSWVRLRILLEIAAALAESD